MTDNDQGSPSPTPEPEPTPPADARTATGVLLEVWNPGDRGIYVLRLVWCAVDGRADKRCIRQ